MLYRHHPVSYQGGRNKGGGRVFGRSEEAYLAMKSGARKREKCMVLSDRWKIIGKLKAFKNKIR